VIDHLRKDFGVEPVCRELELSVSAYRARKSRPPSARFCRDQETLGHIRQIHDKSLGTYGAYRVYKQLRREGRQVARCTVERLMRAHGIEGVVRGRKRKTTVADPAASRPADLVNRRFIADRPDALWVADITYVDTWDGWVYVAFVTDVYSRKIIGWKLDAHLRTDLALDALEMAIHQRKPVPGTLIHHSDRGCQGGFQWSSQHLDRGVWEWVGLLGGWRLRRVGCPCGHRGGRGSTGVRSRGGFGSGSLRVCPARRPLQRAACRRRSGRGGSVRVAGCRLCRWPRRLAGTSRSPSVRRSRCSRLRRWEFVRSRAVWVAMRRRSLVSCVATPLPAAVVWSIEPRSRSGMLSGGRVARRPRNSRSTTGCGTTSAIGSPAP